MATNRHTVFRNPFKGRLKIVEVTPNFLLSPRVHLELAGISKSHALEEMGIGSLTKTIGYHIKRQKVPPWRLLRRMLQNLSSRETRRAVIQGLRKRIRSMPKVDNIALHSLEWVGFLLAASHGAPLEEQTYPARYLLRLSNALIEPAQCFHSGKWVEAARAFYRNELTKKLVSPEISFVMAQTRLPLTKELVQWAVVLETSVSLLAAWCAELEQSQDSAVTGDLMWLLSDVNGRRYGLGRAFLEFLKAHLKQGSLSALADHFSAKGVSSGDESDNPLAIETLKRWSAGKTMPQFSTVEQIARKCLPAIEQRVVDLYNGMIFLTLLGHVTEKVAARVENILHEQSDAPRAQELLASCIGWPLGYENFHDWALERLPFWFSYHRSWLAAETKASATSPQASV